jgi:signal transduction histidine kinase
MRQKIYKERHVMRFKTALQENKMFIVFTILLNVMAFYSINMYMFFINVFKITLLCIFGYSIVYSRGLKQDMFMNNLKISCTVLIIVAILGVSVDIEEYIRFLLLTLTVNNFSIFAYKVLIKRLDFGRYKLLFTYLSIIILEFVARHFFYDINVNNQIAIINLILCLINLMLVLFSNTNKNIDYENILKRLSVVAVLSTTACIFAIKSVALVDKIKFSCLSQFLLCISVYISYIFSVRQKVVVPYSELHVSNEKLNINKNRLDKLNSAIEKDIHIQQTLKNHIIHRKELLIQALNNMPDAWAIMNYDLSIVYSNFKFNKEFMREKIYLKKLLETLKQEKEIFDNNSETFNFNDRRVVLVERIYLLSINYNIEEDEYLVSLTDITQESIMDKRIRDINEDYEKIILNIPCPIMVRTTDAPNGDNTIVSINKSFENSFGVSAKQFRHMTIENYISGFNIDLFDNRSFKRLGLNIDEREDIINYGSADNCIVNFAMIDNFGEERVEEVRVGDYYSDNRLYKSLTFRNITKEIKILKDTNDQKIVYEKLLDAIPEALFLENISTSRVIYTNVAFNKLFGIEDDVLGVNTQKYRNILVKKYINNLKNGDKRKSIHLVNEKNQIKEIEMISRKLYFGQKESRVRIIRDLSVQRESERLKNALLKQRKYDQMKMEFYANISHELKTPLNNIYSSSQLIEKLFDKGKIKETQNILEEHLKITKQNMFRLMRLIDNIINISQVKSEIYKVRAVNFDIIEITEGIVTSISSYSRSKEIDVVFDTNEEEIMVGLDPESIERIILNLISNAIKFTHSGGEILVGIYKRGEEVQIVVRDSGVGIEAEKLKDIFKRFKQIENSGISNEFGSGIGLCLTKSLVEIQNGNIDISSKLGEGTEVTVIFPIKEVVEEISDIREYDNNIEKFEIEFFDIYKEG